MLINIGFIGLGIMGQAMASNILTHGFSLCVWNRTRPKMKVLAQLGAKPADNPTDLAAQSEVVIVCVTDEAAIKEVLFGSDGVCAGARPETLIIDMSTISPQASRENAATLAEKGFTMLDAPVSGSKEGATEGTLSIMVGGAETDFKKAQPIFKSMGRNIVHVGSRCGDGQTVKLVNQLLAAGHTLVMSEALLFAQAGGVDLEKALAAVSAGAAGSWMLTNRGPQVIARDWQPGFTIDLQLKSTGNVLKAADTFGVPVPVTAQLYQYYRTLQARGLGEEGHHALIKALESLSGIKVGPADDNNQ
jgi:3-hydroxyisobutyrate dehydrogenase